MKLYYTPGACSLSPHIALLEAGLPVTLEKVDLRTGKLASGEDFSAISAKANAERPNSDRLKAWQICSTGGKSPAVASLLPWRKYSSQSSITWNSLSRSCPAILFSSSQPTSSAEGKSLLTRWNASSWQPVCCRISKNRKIFRKSAQFSRIQIYCS